MPQLKVLSGQEVIRILGEFGFEISHQHGSHVKLRRSAGESADQTLTVPLHSELDRGTLKAIYRQSLRYIPQDQLRTYFYSE